MVERIGCGPIDLEAARQGPYGIPIFSPEEIALMRAGLDLWRSLPPTIQLSAFLGATFLASFYGLKPRSAGENEKRDHEPEI